jgi:hypothetical protein
MNTDHLVSPTEAAHLKGMSLNLFKYHIQKPGAPTFVLVGVNKHEYYDKREIIKWKPARASIKKLPPANAHGLDPTVTAKPKRGRKDRE